MSLQGPELKKLGKPKRPISQMAYYFQDRMLEWDHSGTVTKYVQQCGDHWKSLSEAEKMHYKKRAEADRGRYDTAMHAWEARMLADGRPELLRTRTLADERRREKQEVKEREGSD
ncbi:PREDICTED: transcription factor A, mitochondrial-like [Priapulus caudatus]|uniref:Transcription factor A, mitochondrial-like n=1 Tax=Priapulus caudatus TaxID=37621 RepID=A0ABM1EM48_PRICU|nr:PREDICTED: transcription factor A, mitochondrial-like [Priapulus caudatus]